MNVSDFLHDMRIRAMRRDEDERIAWWADQCITWGAFVAAVGFALLLS
jgi:hypothetical protein